MKYFFIFFIVSCDGANIVQALNSISDTSSSSVTLISNNENEGGTIVIAASTVDIFPGMLASEWSLKVLSSGCAFELENPMLTGESTSTEMIDKSLDPSNQCIYKNIKSKFNLDSILSVDHLPEGSYKVVLNILDANGKVIEQGVTNTPVINRQVSGIHIQVFPTQGS